MFNYWRKKKQIIAFCLIFFISFLGVFTLGANEAKASFKGDIGGMLGELLLMVQRGVGKITVLLATFSEGILKYTKIQSAEIVTDGWKTVRDLVNMLFILVLLVIAFATILRLENYGMKTLLPKLIGTALLINFSLILAGAVIDFSGVLTDFFIKEDFSINITHKMGLSSTIKSDAGTAENVGEERWRLCETTLESKWASGCQETVYSSEEACEEAERTFSLYDCVNQTRVSWSNVVDTGKYWDVILAIVFSIVFNIIAAFVFGALAFLLLVRVLAIWFLLILAPLAWFFWILPATKGLFTKWWDNFIKWVFFAPAVTFFIWLSITSWEKLISGRTVLVGDPIAAEMMNIPAMPIMPDVLKPGAFVQFFLICGMLIGSLIVAQKMSIYGAKGAISIAKGIGGKVSGVAATQRWWKARKGAIEDEAKDKRKRRMGLATVGGIRQQIKERFRPTTIGRAEARAKKNDQIVKEAKRMGNMMSLQDVIKIAGKQTLPTGAGKMQKLSAQALLANPRSKEHKQMIFRSKLPSAGTREYEKIQKLLGSYKGQQEKLFRYRWGKEEEEKEKEKEPKIIEPVSTITGGRKISEEELRKGRESLKK